MIGSAAKDIAVVVSAVGIWSVAAMVVALRVIKTSDKRKATTITVLERLNDSIRESERANQKRHLAIMKYMQETHTATLKLISNTLDKCNGQ